MGWASTRVRVRPFGLQCVKVFVCPQEPSRLSTGAPGAPPLKEGGGARRAPNENIDTTARIAIARSPLPQQGNKREHYGFT